MPAPVKGWLTPDSPVSTELACRAIYIPSNLEFIGAVNGALLELTKAYNWESFGTLTPQAAADAMSDMYFAWIENSCGTFSCPVVYRIDQFGKLQQSTDGGGSWTDDENGIFIPTPEREEPTSQERRCLASANAAEVLRLTYLDVLVAFDEDTDATFGMAAFATIMAFLLGALFTPVSGLVALSTLLNFALGAFSSAYAGMELLGDDDWTPAYTDDLVCLLYKNSTDTAGVVTFDFEAVSHNILNPTVDAALVFWNWYVLSVIGEQGLNSAGATTSITEAECPCGWCYIWEGSNSPAWTFFPSSNFGGGQRGAFSGGNWISSNGASITEGSVPGSTEIMMKVSPSFATVVTSIVIEFEKTIGTASLSNQDRIIVDSPNGWYNGTTIELANPGTDNVTPPWVFTGSQAFEDEITIWMSAAIYFPTGSFGSITITKITMEGTGDNPFGDDNC